MNKYCSMKKLFKYITYIHTFTDACKHTKHTYLCVTKKI